MADALIATNGSPGTGSKSGLRSMMRKWREKLKKDRASSPSRSIQSQHHQPVAFHTPSHSSSPSPKAPKPPDALFAPTTQTVISSPNDPRNKSGSSSSSPRPTLRKHPPNSRRNTAPADYFANNTTAIPVNTITTTITALSPYSPANRRSSRLRLSLSKRSPVQPLAPSTSSSSTSQRPPLASISSEPNPIDHANQRATSRSITPASMNDNDENLAEPAIGKANKLRARSNPELRDEAENEHERKRNEDLKRTETVRLVEDEGGNDKEVARVEEMEVDPVRGTC